MKHLKFGFLAIASVVVLMGCATARSPVSGFWYADVRSGVAATSNQAGNRVGEACASSILGLIATGDSSIEAARRNGGITMISSVDEKAKSILGLWAEYCTIVRGR
ncbi:TRL-like family protein [Bdellovibrionota bacterium FG-1]